MGILGSRPARGAVWYVAPETVASTRDGRSWTTPFSDMAPALQAGRQGDEVWVARGTYSNSIVIPSGVRVLGGFSGGETNRSQRAPLSLLAEFSRRIGGTIRFAPGASNAVLDGFSLGASFTVAGTNSQLELRNLTWMSPGARFAAVNALEPVMQFQSCGLTLSNVVVASNRSGPADLLNEGQRHNSLIRLAGCTFVIERSVFSTISGARSILEIVGGPGGVLRGNRWQANRLGYGIPGSLVVCSNAAPVIEGNWFADSLPSDLSPSAPPTLVLTGSSAPTIRNNLFTGLVAPAVTASTGSSPVLLHNTFLSRSGTVLQAAGNRVLLYCNLFVRPDPAAAGTAIVGPASRDLVSGNCFSGYGTTSRISGGFVLPTASNPHLDIPWPFATEPGLGSASLAPDSPAINVAPLRTDVGATDFAGNPRRQEQLVDAGAFESGAASPAGARLTIHVQTDGDDGDSGTGWASAKRSIRSAVREAVIAGGTVRIGPGTWSGSQFLPYGVDLEGGFTGSESDPIVPLPFRTRTVLSGDDLSRILGHADGPLAARTGLPLQSISGLQFRNGFSDDGSGGALMCGSLRMVGCRFDDNTVRWTPDIASSPFPTGIGGGAVAARGFVDLERCVFRGNQVQEPLSTNRSRIFLQGGALLAKAGAAIRNSLFSENHLVQRSAGTSTTAPVNSGVAIHLVPAEVRSEVRNCTFTGNLVPGAVSGTAAIQTPAGAPNAPGWAIYDCVFAGNHATYQAGTSLRYLVGDAFVSSQVHQVTDPETVLESGPAYPRLRAGSGLVRINGSVLTETFDLDGTLRPRTGADPGAFEFSTNRLESTYPAERTVRVAPDGDDRNDGSSWALPVRTLESAVARLRGSGGEAWVRGGVYRITNAVVVGDGVRLLGGFAGAESRSEERDWTSNSTVVVPASVGTVPRQPLVTIAGGPRPVVISGFVFTNGFGIPAGAVRLLGGSARLTENRFLSNRGQGEFGASAVAGAVLVGNTRSMGRLANNLFASNSIVSTIGPGLSGSALAVESLGVDSGAPSALLELVNNTFLGNSHRVPASARYTVNAPLWRGSLVANNLVVNNDAGLGVDGTGVVVSSNLVWRSGAASFREGILTNDPTLFLVEGRWLAPHDSPVVDRGFRGAVAADRTDLLGQPRTRGGAPDIGAVEVETLLPGPGGLVSLQFEGSSAVADVPTTVPFRILRGDLVPLGYQLVLNGAPQGPVYGPGQPLAWTPVRIGPQHLAVRVFTVDRVFDSDAVVVSVSLPPDVRDESISVSSVALGGEGTPAPASHFVSVLRTSGILALRSIDPSGRTNTLPLASPTFQATLQKPGAGVWWIEGEDRYGRVFRASVRLTSPAERSEYLFHHRATPSFAVFLDINEAGVAVGWLNDQGLYRGVRWSGGDLEWVAPSETSNHGVACISESGLLGGWVTADAPPRNTRAAIFENGSARVVDEACSQVVAINRRGDMLVMEWDSTTGEERPVRIVGGQRRILGGIGGARLMVHAMNADGWVVGWATDPLGNFRPLLWTNDVPQLLPGTKSGIGHAWCINDSGVIGGQVDGGGVVWRGLRPETPWPASLHVSDVFGINRKGWILGPSSEGIVLVRDGRPAPLVELFPRNIPAILAFEARRYGLTADGSFAPGVTQGLAVAVPRQGARPPRILLRPDAEGRVAEVGMALLPFGANPVIERSTNGVGWTPFTYGPSAPLRESESAVGLFRVRLANP